MKIVDIRNNLFIPILWVLIAVLNMATVYQIISTFGPWLDTFEREAIKDRKLKLGVLPNKFFKIYEIFSAFEKNLRQYQFYKDTREKIKRAGYRSEFAAVNYLVIKFPILSIIFLYGLFIGKIPPLSMLVVAISYLVILETSISRSQKKMNMKFQKFVYKIYKYLHNQIAAGVKVTDAIRTVYEVVDDQWLKGILIELAGGYELTCDIDKVLEKFKHNFSSNETDTLCIAIKQGIATGDNQNLLERQEEIMFKKYFNHIQAQTDSCRVKIAAVAMIFTAIMVTMLLIPVISDVGEAMGKIFIN